MDPSTSPLIFRPQGYLVAIPADSEEGERAKATLTSAGYEPDDMRLYSGEEILANHELYNERRSVGGRIVGAVTDDTHGREMYLGYAREGRCALWVRIPDEGDVPKALRALAKHDLFHSRYYGDERQDDIHSS
jgi:hypothetical protein